MQKAAFSRNDIFLAVVVIVFFFVILSPSLRAATRNLIILKADG
jgi:hypothetical protein